MFTESLGKLAPRAHATIYLYIDPKRYNAIYYILDQVLQEVSHDKRKCIYAYLNIFI